MKGKDLFARDVQCLINYYVGCERQHFEECAMDEGINLEDDAYDKDVASEHIYHSIHRLNDAGMVTLEHLSSDESLPLRRALDNLVCYANHHEIDHFEESGFNPLHIYLVAQRLHLVLVNADMKTCLGELGDAIEEGDPQEIANVWLQAKPFFEVPHE